MTVARLSQTEIIVKQIKGAGNTKAAISSMADLLLNVETARREEKERVVELRRVIAGNGDPSKSLLSRMEQTEKTQAIAVKTLAHLNELIIGSVENGTDEDNILWMVKNNKRVVNKVANNLTRLVWLVAGGLISAMVAGVISLIKYGIIPVIR